MISSEARELPAAHPMQSPPASRDRSRSLVALGLFALFAVVYWISVPDAFNTVRSNERLFGSDGEFITRQFRQGEIFTHNDHLLYHVMATVLHGAAPWIPGLEQNAVAVHKVLSVGFGAAPWSTVAITW